MSYSSTYINVANLPKDLQDRVKVALAEETRQDISDTALYQQYVVACLEQLIQEQRITNKYLAEILGDTIE